MDRTRERLLLAATLLPLLLAGLDGFLVRSAAPDITRSVAACLLLAAIAGGVAFVRERLARRAAEERLDRGIEKRERPETALFGPSADDIEPFTAARSLRIYERFLAPLAAPLCAAVAAGFAWRSLAAPPAAPAAISYLQAAAWAGFEAFVLFLFGRVLLGLSRDAGHRALRAPGSLLALAGLACLAAAAAYAAGSFGVHRAERVVTLLASALLALLAVEWAANAVAEVYRPRAADRASVSFESRLARLLTDPASWSRGIGRTLDYQFGFRVSQTWLYRFLGRALLPFALLLIAVLYSLTCFVFLGPDEEGVLERFGGPRPGAWRLCSGAHVKWPWPFETVRRFPVRRIQTIYCGHAGGPAGQPGVILWTEPHYATEDLFLVAHREPGARAPERGAAVAVNLLALNVPVEFVITNMLQYAYSSADPVRLLGHIAHRGLAIETVSRDLFDVLGAGQAGAAASVRRRIQDEADRLGLGVDIAFVGLQGVHPPIPVAAAFESVVGALEGREAAILSAHAHTNRVLPLARAEADRALRAAEAYRNRRGLIAAAEAHRFTKRLEAWKMSPAVFRARTYLATLRGALAGARKYIIAADVPHEVIQFNFEEKPRPDLFDFGPRENAKGTAP
jgi:regulator of protease activity HflC (stomatin/prohibitin superfamily)